MRNDRPTLPAAPVAEARIRELAKTCDVAWLRIRLDTSVEMLPLMVHVAVRVDDYWVHRTLDWHSVDRMYPEAFDAVVEQTIDIAEHKRQAPTGHMCRRCSGETIPA